MIKKDFAAVIGNFDGVHKGHQHILDTLEGIANRHGLKTMAITFDTHPRQIFDPTFKPSFLTTLDERVALLQQHVDEVKVLHFDHEFAAIPAHDFMEHQLRDEMGVRTLLLGYDNRFGKRNPTENFDSYMDYGQELGINILLANPINISLGILPIGKSTGEGQGREAVIRVSSSQVRHAVMAGRMEEVTETLGRPYSITGTVVPGHQEGHKIGFPTANILPQEGKILPPNGVYATLVTLGTPSDPRNPSPPSFKAMTNIGDRPTFDNGKNISIESNIFDFNEDIYGKTITVSFLHYIRPEQKFDSVEDLVKQMNLDKEKAQ